jgi:hypothetical protein
LSFVDVSVHDAGAAGGHSTRLATRSTARTDLGNNRRRRIISWLLATPQHKLNMLVSPSGTCDGGYGTAENQNAKTSARGENADLEAEPRIF